MKTKRIGVIEIGSRSVRILVADITELGDLRAVFTDYKQTHLAAAVKIRGKLLEDKMTEVHEIVKRFLGKANELESCEVTVFGTEALRQIVQQQVFDLSKNMPFVTVLTHI